MQKKIHHGSGGREIVEHRAAVLPMQGKRHKGENPNSFTELLFS